MENDALLRNYCDRLESHKKELAVLQLAGNIEDYLVRQFFVAVSEHSNGELFAATIGGANRGDGTREPRVDICVLKGSLRASQKDLRVVSMLEAKYFANSRLLGLGKSANAMYDKDVRRRLKTLHEQALRLKRDYGKCKTLDGIQVSSDAVPNRCALVLAGYQCAKPDVRSDTRSGKEDFDARNEDVVFGKLQKALEEKFVVDEVNGLRPVYGTSATVLGMQYTVVLKAGLFEPRP